MTPSGRRLRAVGISVARTSGVAWLTLVALMLVMANEVAIPLDFLARPMLVAVLPAFVIGVASTALGRFATLAAVVVSPLVLIPELWPFAVGLLALEIGVGLVQRWSHAGDIPVGRFAFVTVIVLILVSAVRLSPLVLDYFAPASTIGAHGGPPVYVVLVDGYPRVDSLETLGIDNSAFISELESRGFEHYPEATSAHQWTHRTLQAMIAGSASGIPDETGTSQDERALRAQLQLPARFLAIDPPTGHVTMRGGAHASAGGTNDFEARLLGTSLVGALAPEWAASLVGDGLRDSFERSLELIVESDADRTFAHLMAPHPPFVYADGPAECWPARCDIFDIAAKELEMSISEWAGQMDRQLPAVNDRLLATVDSVLANDPDAVIVLFSDHGGRYGGGHDESHHSFLMARTPGNPALFTSEPHPHAVLRLLEEAYP